MSGGSPRHSRLGSRMIARLDTALAGKPCDVHTADLRLGIGDDHFVYADAVVACRPLAFRQGTTDVVTNPVVVVEVLSKTTESYDRGEKQAAYLAIPSLYHFVLVSQRSPRVEVYTRENDGSFRFRVHEAGSAVRLERDRRGDRREQSLRWCLRAVRRRLSRLSTDPIEASARTRCTTVHDVLALDARANARPCSKRRWSFGSATSRGSINLSAPASWCRVARRRRPRPCLRRGGARTIRKSAAKMAPGARLGKLGADTALQRTKGQPYATKGRGPGLSSAAEAVVGAPDVHVVTEGGANGDRTGHVVGPATPPG